MTELAAERTLQRARRARGRWSLLVSAVTAVLLLCQAIIWYQPLTPILAVLDQFAIQFACLALLAMLVGLVLKRWLQAVALAALAVTLSWPVFAYKGDAAVVADPARLKVVSANLWHSAEGHARTIDILLASDADIIGLIEVTPAWRAALGPLLARYPHRVDCFERDPECLHMVLSKLPIEKPIAGRIWNKTPIVAGAQVRWRGRPITVLAVHWFRPHHASADSQWGEKDPERAAYMAEGLPLSRQGGQAGLLAEFINSLPDEVILMGDLNSVPWSRVQRAFRERTGLDSQAGWSFTWPAFLPWPLRLPIDHILARGHLVVTRLSSGPATDSDHLPVSAEIGWRD
jgi:endonuclease/exonuclease/phosphatase (EEP) superfamily protein YafD